MAGLPWLQLDHDLPRNRKSLRLVHRLQDDRAWAYMVQLWCWCAENNPWGTFEGDDGPAILERAAGWKGAPGELVEAAVFAEFLDRTERGLVVHDAEKRFAAHIKHRESQRGRQRRSRASRRNDSVRVTRDMGVTAAPCHTNVTPPDVDVDRDVDRELKDVRTSAPEVERESPLLEAFRVRIEAGTASTKRLLVAADSAAVPGVRAELEGLLSGFGLDEAVRVSMAAAAEARRKEARWPSALLFYVKVLRSEAARRRTDPRKAERLLTPAQDAAQTQRSIWLRSLPKAQAEAYWREREALVESLVETRASREDEARALADLDCAWAAKAATPEARTA